MTAQGSVNVCPWDIVPKDISPDMLDTEYIALHNYRYGSRPMITQAEILELARCMHPFLVDLCCYLVSQGLEVQRAEGYIGEHPEPIGLHIYSSNPSITVKLLGLGYANNNGPYYTTTRRYIVNLVAYGTHGLMDIITDAMRYRWCDSCYYGGGYYCGMGMVMDTGECTKRLVV